MKSLVGPRVKVTLDYDRSVTGSFSGDDADKYSLPFDLGGIYKYILIELPAITSSTLSVVKHTQDATQGDGLTEVPTPIVFQLGDNTTEVWAASASATAKALICPVGSIQYGRLLFNTNQAADRECWVQGFN